MPQKLTTWFLYGALNLTPRVLTRDETQWMAAFALVSVPRYASKQIHRLLLGAIDVVRLLAADRTHQQYLAVE
jgi:hypothetical protein